MAHTSSGDSDLCGHFSDFGAFVLAFDARRLGSGWAVWKEECLLSYVKYPCAMDA